MQRRVSWVSLQLQLPDAIDREAWAAWIGYRRERILPMSSRALAQHIKALLPYPSEIQRAMIEQSIANGWKGLFELRDHGCVTAASEPAIRTSSYG